MHDLVIRNATVVDGTGRERFEGDVAIDNGHVAEVGQVAGKGKEEIDASGLLAMPGWVDVHTHYDGQVTWDPLLTPSFWHGVTTVVMGNCGVGFAPAAPEQREWLVGLMEGVEDIPGTALNEGIRWDWESFPEYLDALERCPHAIDVAAHIAHGPVRAYVMGERGATNEPASAEDIARMAELVGEAMRAGALGFSSSRTLLHLAIDGEPVPGTFAAEDELMAFARVLGEHGSGIFEVAPAGVSGEDLAAPEKEIAWMQRVSAATGCPITFLLGQNTLEPDAWRRMLQLCEQADAEGARVYPQVFGRPTNLLFSFEGVSPFARYPSFAPLMDMTPKERMPFLRDPSFRAKVLSESDPNDDVFAMMMKDPWHQSFELGDPPDYEPDASCSLAARAARDGVDPRELAWDILLGDDGRAVVLWALLGYADGDLEPVREMLEHPLSAVGGSDGGAHCRMICDSSVPTFLLTHWTRDRSRGPRLPLESVVKKQSRDTARLYGLDDRGEIKPGQKADINLVDYDALSIGVPRMVYDLPGGAPRFMQKAVGYKATLVAGQVVQRDGEDSGARPGRVVRGPQSAYQAGQ
jgi:N-acyl-D-aspartate/D-glutamate deacylase